jgi:hypothetical protein
VAEVALRFAGGGGRGRGMSLGLDVPMNSIDSTEETEMAGEPGAGGCVEGGGGVGPRAEADGAHVKTETGREAVVGYGFSSAGCSVEEAGTTRPLR